MQIIKKSDMEREIESGEEKSLGEKKRRRGGREVGEGEGLERHGNRHNLIICLHAHAFITTVPS